MAEEVQTSKAQIEWRFEDIIAIILRWKWVLMFFAFAIPIISYFFSLTITPVYNASVIVTVGGTRPETEALQGAVGGGTARIKQYNLTEEQLFIKSQAVMGDVVRELNLDISLVKKEKVIDKILDILKKRYYQTQNFRQNVSRVSLTGNSRGGVILDFINPRSFHVVTLVGNKYLGRGELGKTFQSEEATFLVEKLPAKNEDKFILQQFDVNKVAESLSYRVNVDVLGQRSFGPAISMKIDFSHSDPTLTKDVANMIAVAYLKRKLEESSQNINQVLQFVDQQMGAVSERVESNINEMENFKQTAGLSFFEQTAQSKITGIRDLEYVKDKDTLQINILQNLINTLESSSAPSDQDLMVAGNIQNPLVHSMVQEISDLRTEREVLAQKYTAEHPAIKDIDTRIELLKGKIIEALRGQIAFLTNEIEMADQAIQRYTSQLNDMSESRRNLSKLQTVDSINRQMLGLLIRKNEEAKISRAAVVPEVRIVTPASKAVLIKPLRQRYILSGILAGLLVGIAMAMFLEYMDNTIKSAGWVERHLGIPVFGMIPNFLAPEFRRDKSTISMEGQRDINLIIQQDPKSHVAESYRSLRTNIQFANLEDKLKVILLTSPGPKEGKSTTIANLAITMANMGSKTLVIDCDLRKPIMHRFFGISRDIGVSDVLSKNMNWRDAVLNTGIDHCFVMTSGKTPPNPSELLGSKRMESFLKEAREEYDVILIDTSPIIAVTDPVVLGAWVDAIFLVFEIGRTTMDAAARAINILETVHLKPKGIIINNIKPEDRRAYGYGYGYGYGYRYGYRYYKYYNYYNYYYGEEGQEPKGRLQSFLDKISGRKS